MSWLRRLVRRNRVEADLDRELRDHIERQVADFVNDGLSEAEARRRARLEFGGLDQIKELCRDVRGTRAIEDLLQDTRSARRVLLKQPGFSSVAIITLALGIGANVAIFSLIDAILLRPLPVSHSSTLVSLVRVLGGNTSDHFTYPQVKLLEQTGLFAALSGLNSEEFNVGLPENLERVSGAWVSSGFYATLGLTPAAGRLLVATDDRPEAAPVAVISDAFWASHFSRDPSAIGRSLHIEGVSVPIVGVTPAGFTGAIVGQVSDITLAVSTRPVLQPENADSLTDDSRWLAVLARPAANLSIEQLRVQLATVWPQLLAATTPASLSPEARKRALSMTLDVRSAGGGISPLRRTFSNPLFASMVLVTLVLLIACVNVANLMLSRATTRQREIALRLAVGASRGRVVRQVLTESALLAAAGAVLGLAVAMAVGRALVRLVSDARPGDGGALVLPIDPDWRTVVFTSIVAVASLTMFAVIPALRTSVVQPVQILNIASSRIAGLRSRLGASLVALQVALSILLVASAGLFAQTLINLRSYDRGFRQDDLIVMSVDHTRTGRSGAELSAFFDEVLTSIRHLPGVRFASFSAITPLQGGGISQSAIVNNEHTIEDVYYNNVGPEYFDALATPLLLGRVFTPQDVMSPDGVAIVNETFVHQYLKPGNPLGQSVQMKGFRMGGVRNLRIVGVVKDAVYETLRAAAPATIYAPYVHRSPGTVTLLVHAPGSTTAVTSAIKSELQPKLNGRLLRVQTMTAQLESSIARERLLATIATLFGALALALAAIGLYGLLSYWVSRRTHEIGVRMALGADRATVVAFVIKDAMWLLAIGCALGGVTAWGLARFVKGLVFGVPANDPATIAGSILVLTAAGIIAAWLPARRATLIDPITALRVE